MEKENLHNSFRNIIDEAKLVFPGTQTLFGFQLVITFSEYFQTNLSAMDKLIHFFAISLTILAFAMILTVTAYHRNIHYSLITKDLVIFAHKLLKLVMLPLAMAISSDFYLVSYSILQNRLVAIFSAFVCLATLWFMWFFLPKKRLQRTLSNNS
jgi:ABC-type multidrug transport system permease subunit